jgi:hypothetical protein
MSEPRRHTFAVLGPEVAQVSVVIKRWASGEDRVIGVRLDVFLEVLGTLEGFTAEIAFMGLERDMNSDVRGNVVPLEGGGPAASPLARETQVVAALSADVSLAEMILRLTVNCCTLRTPDAPARVDYLHREPRHG